MKLRTQMIVTDNRIRNGQAADNNAQQKRYSVFVGNQFN